MKLTFTIGLIWILISVYNFLKYIPQQQKEKTNFWAFAGFTLISPIITIGFYFLYAIKGIVVWLQKN